MQQCCYRSNIFSAPFKELCNLFCIPATFNIVHLYHYLPIMPQKFPGFVIDVPQVNSTNHAGCVQVSQVSNVCCIFRYFLSRAYVTVEKFKVELA